MSSGMITRTSVMLAIRHGTIVPIKATSFALPVLSVYPRFQEKKTKVLTAICSKPASRFIPAKSWTMFARTKRVAPINPETTIKMRAIRRSLFMVVRR